MTTTCPYQCLVITYILFNVTQQQGSFLEPEHVLRPWVCRLCETGALLLMPSLYSALGICPRKMLLSCTTNLLCSLRKLPLTRRTTLPHLHHDLCCRRAYFFLVSLGPLFVFLPPLLSHTHTQTHRLWDMHCMRSGRKRGSSGWSAMTHCSCQRAVVPSRQCTTGESILHCMYLTDQIPTN